MNIIGQYTKSCRRRTRSQKLETHFTTINRKNRGSVSTQMAKGTQTYISQRSMDCRRRSQGP